MPGKSEEYLRQVTLGKVVPHDAPVFLAPYDPAWPAAYEHRAIMTPGKATYPHTALHARGQT